MKALCWFGTKDVRVESVPDPKIINPHDAILKVTSTAICGSDVHLYDGLIPTLQPGDILGHEFMGEVVEVGKKVSKLSVGDRVAVPFNIACGHCYFCNQTLFSLCDNSNPNATKQEKITGQATSGLFGYSHLYGGYAGGQAEYVRVPYADVGPLKIPASLPDEKVLFLTDILPTGYMAAENCNIQPGDTVAVWGCGPVGLFAMKCARLLGAERVIGIDRFPARLELARSFAGAETIDYGENNTNEMLREMTGGRGPDSCIDAVGMEAHGTDLEAIYDTVKQTLKLESDRPMALREIIECCRKGGTVSIPGVYAGFIDKFPFGVAFAKGLSFRMGQTHTHRYMRPLLDHIEKGDIEPELIISHSLPLSKAASAYEIFAEKKESCTKVVLKP